MGFELSQLGMLSRLVHHLPPQSLSHAWAPALHTGPPWTHPSQVEERPVPRGPQLQYPSALVGGVGLGGVGLGGVGLGGVGVGGFTVGGLGGGTVAQMSEPAEWGPGSFDPFDAAMLTSAQFQNCSGSPLCMDRVWKIRSE